jgi:NTE family protein
MRWRHLAVATAPSTARPCSVNEPSGSVSATASVWQPSGPEPQSIMQVLSRQKDVQYSSRAASHIAKQKQIHHFRHVIRELTRRLPASQQADPAVRELAAWGCTTTMHVVRLLAPRLENEDQTKDMDFTASRVRARWQAGCDDTRAMLERAPWEASSIRWKA